MTQRLKNVLIPIEVVVLCILIFSIQLTGAFLTTKEVHDLPLQIGKIDVKVEVYFEKDGVKKTVGIDYEFRYGEGPDDVIVKPGVYYVNISSETDIQYLPNLRVNLVVRSNVDTYFRVAIYEQLTMLYTANGITRETALTNEGYMPFGYIFAPLSETTTNQIETHGFFDNRAVDGFIYYTNKVTRASIDTPLVLPLIGEFDDSVDFAPYGDRYRLQVGFIVDAVQAYHGPEINWEMNNTPWRNSALENIW